MTIERYLHRLRLDGSTPESILNLLDKIPSSDRPMMHAVARRAIWESPSRGEILSRYVAESLKRGVYRVDDAVGLLNLVESYKPSGVAELLSMEPIVDGDDAAWGLAHRTARLRTEYVCHDGFICGCSVAVPRLLSSQTPCGIVTAI